MTKARQKNEANQTIGCLFRHNKTQVKVIRETNYEGLMGNIVLKEPPL